MLWLQYDMTLLRRYVSVVVRSLFQNEIFSGCITICTNQYKTLLYLVLHNWYLIGGFDQLNGVVVRESASQSVD